MKRLSKLLLLIPAVAALTLSAPSLAGNTESTLEPDVPKPVKGEKCVEDTAEMRRNHMKYLLQHRDKTMHEGIRTKKYSLKECLECHVPAQEEAKAEAGEGQHFCQSCHTYAGVRVDCFECHATRPEKSAMFHPIVTPNMNVMKGAHQGDSEAMLNRLAADNVTATGAIDE